MRGQKEGIFRAEEPQSTTRGEKRRRGSAGPRGDIKTYNELHSVAKRSVQQPAHGVAELQGDLLGGKRQHGRQRDDGEEVECEDGGRVPAELAGEDGNGHDEEQEVDIACVFSSARPRAISISIGGDAGILTGA
jgi:hypothetical protein